MNCDKCHMIGFSGNAKVCGYFLQDGETVYVHDGKINGQCPLEIKDYEQNILMDSIQKLEREVTGLRYNLEKVIEVLHEMRNDKK